MALRKIVVQGEECLTKVCRPVTEFNPHLHQLLDDMLETLEDANGAGLAAPQVGVLRRVCVVLDEDSEEYIELVNPEIVAQSGEQTGLEGCLSVPGKWGIVTRAGRGPGPGPGPVWRLVRGGGRGPDGPSLLPRDRASGRPSVCGAHRPLPL